MHEACIGVEVDFLWLSGGMQCCFMVSIHSYINVFLGMWYSELASHLDDRNKVHFMSTSNGSFLHN